VKQITKYSRILILLLVAVGLTFCKKHQEASVDNSSNLPDNIIYTDLVPDTSVSSVQKNLPPYQMPPPKDSSAQIDLDVDHDGINDITVGADVIYFFISASDPGANYWFGLGLGTIREQDSVPILITSPPCFSTARPYQKDELIFNNSHFSIGSLLSSSGSPQDPCECNTLSGDTYYGFKLYDHGGYDYGWILLNGGGTSITVKAFAINKTKNNPIKAGQIK